jgi:hypothetical protein
MPVIPQAHIILIAIGRSSDFILPGDAVFPEISTIVPSERSVDSSDTIWVTLLIIRTHSIG